MKRIIICNLPKFKDIDIGINFQNNHRTLTVTDMITDEDIKLHLNKSKIYDFLIKKTGITSLCLRYDLNDGTFYALLLTKKQINKVKKEYPEFYI